MSNDKSDDKKRTVRVQRRRRVTPEQDRQRAAQPGRRQPSRPVDSGGGQIPPIPSFPSSGGTGARRSPNILVIGLLLLLLLCLVPIILFFNRDSGDDSTIRATQLPEGVSPTSVASMPSATTPAVTFAPPSKSTEGQTWLVILYQDADDKILEQDIYFDLNEVERAGSTDRVHIVTQTDRYQAGFQGDGNWQSARRYYVTQDDDLNRLSSQLVADLGEVNMSDANTLVDYATWAIETFPADKHVLILSDHGMGWPGGWSDPAPGGSGDPDIPLAAKLGNQLYLMELDQALGEILSQTGLKQFELIGLDACLMGHLEVYSALAPYARFAVASQETEPALGWAYTDFLKTLNANPDMDGEQLSQYIVESYINADQRIQDDQARAEMLKQGSPMGGLFSLFGQPSAEQVVSQMEDSITLTAVDLSAIPQLLNAFNDFSFQLQGEDPSVVAKARNYARSFTSIFGDKVPPSYLDLGNFAQLLQRESLDDNVRQSVEALIAAIGDAVIAERHGDKKSGATGISIYFPNSQIYRSPVTGAESYTAIAQRFAETSLWDDFLNFHYTGETFELSAQELVVPGPGSEIGAPGSGTIQASPMTISERVVAPGETILLSTDIRGENIGYIYLFVGYYDSASNSVYVADRDYLESGQTRELDGVYYPEWGEGEFRMEFEWEPVVFAISNGDDFVPALFKPESYGETFEDAVYTVDGIYTYADGGESLHARLYFVDGILRQVFGFRGEADMGAPREIIPQAGDIFTVLDTWMDLDARGNVVQTVTQEGDSLVFGDQMFTWQSLDAAPGTYIVGFVIEDLDGQAYELYEQVEVE